VTDRDQSQKGVGRSGGGGGRNLVVPAVDLVEAIQEFAQVDLTGALGGALAAPESDVVEKPGSDAPRQET